MIEIDWSLNYVNEWIQPGQHPLYQYLLSSCGTVINMSIEIYAIAIFILKSGFISTSSLIFKPLIKLANRFFHIKKLAEIDAALPGIEELKKTVVQIGTIMVGLASTLLCGIVGIPDINLKFHVKLGLAEDKLSVKKEKELQAKLEAEAKAREIKRDRAERYAKFKEERHRSALAEFKEEEIADTELAERLVPSLRLLESQLALLKTRGRTAKAF